MEKLNNEKQRDYTIEDLEELLDNIPFEVWIKDENGKYKYINKVCADRIVKKKEDIIGKTDSCDTFILSLKTNTLTKLAKIATQ